MRFVAQVAILAVLLIPAWGWAFDKNMVVRDLHDNELIRCNEGMTQCKINSSIEVVKELDKRPSCSVRMREAMNWANELEKIRSGELFLEPRDRTAKWYFDGKKQFDQTMKDCVEGR